MCRILDPSAYGFGNALSISLLDMRRRAVGSFEHLRTSLLIKAFLLLNLIFVTKEEGSMTQSFSGVSWQVDIFNIGH